MPFRAPFLLFYPFTFLLFGNSSHVASVARVDGNGFAFVDEERHAHLCTRLNGCGLGSVCSRVALYARLTVRDDEVGLDRHFGRKNGAVSRISLDVDDVALFHKLATGNHVLGNWNLLKGFLIHENAPCAVLIQILIGTVLDADVVKFEANLERALQHAAVGNVLKLGVHNGVALAWLAVLEVDTLPDATVHTDTSSDFYVL